MSRHVPRLALVALLLIFIGTVTFVVARCLPDQSQRAKRGEPAAVTIASSGEMLGLRIGATLEQARSKLNTSHISFAERRGKERDQDGEQTYWKLDATEYSWIMAWTNKEGRIVQLSASVRPEKLKPFEEVGDPAKASTNLQDVAIWNVVRPDNLSYRLVAKGPNRRATIIYMIATALERD
jgi:nitrate/nitrite-specific signal transduction histidine kinase